LCSVDGGAKEVAGVGDRFSHRDTYASLEAATSRSKASLNLDCAFNRPPSRSEVRQQPISHPFEYVTLVFGYRFFADLLVLSSN